MGLCSATTEFGGICDSGLNLNLMVFIDPVTRRAEFAELCQLHSNKIVNNLLDAENKLIKIRRDLYAKINKQKIRGRQYEINPSMKEQSKLEGVKTEIQRQRWEICRYYLCKKERSYFLNDEKIYLAIAVSTRGKMRHSFNLHRECWVELKGVCGLVTPIMLKQKTLEVREE